MVFDSRALYFVHIGEKSRKSWLQHGRLRGPCNSNMGGYEHSRNRPCCNQSFQGLFPNVNEAEGPAVKHHKSSNIIGDFLKLVRVRNWCSDWKHLLVSFKVRAGHVPGIAFVHSLHCGCCHVASWSFVCNQLRDVTWKAVVIFKRCC